MTLSDLASVGGLIGGLAVLASLVYLARQLRQAEKNQRALMNQGLMTRSIDVLLRNNDPVFNDIQTRLHAGETDFSAQELRQITNQLRVRLNGFQDAYVQHRSGLADEIAFELIRSSVRAMLAQPVYRALWRLARSTYTPEWAAHVDRLIAETPLAGPVDLVAQFKVALAEVTASKAG